MQEHLATLVKQEVQQNESGPLCESLNAAFGCHSGFILVQPANQKVLVQGSVTAAEMTILRVSHQTLSHLIDVDS